MQELIDTLTRPNKSRSGNFSKESVNIPLGTRVLAKYRDQFASDPLLAIAAYNAGPGAAQRWRKDRAGLSFDLWVELIPYVEKNFRALPYRVLVGHSLGGRFALMTTCRAPGIFQSVVAISPGGVSKAICSVTAFPQSPPCAT